VTGRLNALTAPFRVVSIANAARSRASTYCTARSRGSGASTSPPAAMRRNHQGSRPMFSPSENEPGSGEDTALGAEHAFNGELRTALVGGVVGGVTVRCAFDGRRLSVMTPSWNPVHRDRQMYT